MRVADGVTLERLISAVRSGDANRVRAMLGTRPELVRMEVADHDEHRALHYAVLDRSPEMVRILMRHGADARQGIYPHRDATSALVIATDRGYDEIVAIIHDEEQRRRSTTDASTEPTPAMVTFVEEATPTAWMAVALGKADWLRARHAEASRSDAMYEAEFGPSAGLLTIAVTHDRPDMLALLLDLGLDPDERTRLDHVGEPVYSAGSPLHHCAGTGKLAMAQMLLERGANPNAQVYASGSAVYRAYVARDSAMIALLERHGGVLDAVTAGLLHEKDAARRMLEDEASDRLREGTVHGMLGGASVAEDLLWGAAGAGDVEIVRMAIEHIDWPRDDPRWYAVLREPMYIGTARPQSEREALITCFRMVLDRCDPNVQGSRARGWVGGRTLLHDLSASRHDMLPDDRLAIATMLLDGGARLDVRDDLLASTPLGWACRWGRVELVHPLLARGADPVESDAEAWATPLAWATKMGHDAVVAALQGYER
jgi:ankyrin repeat protein